jgi:hypothetical protein
MQQPVLLEWDTAQRQIGRLCEQVFYHLEQLYEHEMAERDKAGRGLKKIMGDMRSESLRVR